MIKKLRIKFICVIMSIVMVLLGCILTSGAAGLLVYSIIRLLWRSK